MDNNTYCAAKANNLLPFLIASMYARCLVS